MNITTNQPPLKHEEIHLRYRRAQSLVRALCPGSLIFNTTIYPHWIENSDCFWYTQESKQGVTYRLVDAKQATSKPAFNHDDLAASLAKASGEAVNAAALPISDVALEGDLDKVAFKAFDKRWQFDQHSGTCQAFENYPLEWSLSPDAKKAAFLREHNVWIRDLHSGEERALTQDGERLNVYASLPTTYGRQEGPAVLQALWSADSKRLFTLQTDTRPVKVGPPLVHFSPEHSDPRPCIINSDRRVAAPGDKHIDVYRFLSIEVDSGHIQRADYRPCPVFWPPYNGYFSTHRGWWSEDNRRAYFIDLARGGLQARLVEFDTDTGATRVVVDELIDTRFTFIPASHTSAMLMPLPGGKELVWFSERTGWAHLYLYDIETGQLKNPITQGEWLVRNILHYDIDRRELLIQTADRVAGRNAYYSDICRVNIDTGQLTDLLSTDHEYVVCNQRSRVSFMDKTAIGVSPNGDYIVTTRSRVDDTPVSLLLDRQGNTVMTIETADLSGMPDGWQWPKPEKTTAADGKTDIYSVVFRPSHFSPDRSYPVVDFSYDYLMPVGSFSNNGVGSWMYLTAASIAELGFIVVMTNSRGTGLRHKSFDTDRDTLYKSASSPLWTTSLSKSDCVTAIKQLADKYLCMDLNRVGVYGGNSPGALVGMFGFPDFYKVGVTSNSCADMRLTAAFDEYDDNQRPSLKEAVPLIYEDAKKLSGKLLLMHGMLDDVHPVGLTFHIISALQKANKDFDLLLLPDDGHELSNYAERRAWDYLVTHLAGEKPPKEFEL